MPTRGGGWVGGLVWRVELAPKAASILRDSSEEFSMIRDKGLASPCHFNFPDARVRRPRALKLVTESHRLVAVL